MKKNNCFSSYEKESSDILRDNICELWQTKFIQNGIPEQNQNVAQQNCIYAMQFDKIGEKLAFSTQDHEIKLWGVLNQQQLGILEGHNEIVTCIVWFKEQEEEQLLATCSLDKTIKIWKGEKCIDSLEEHQDWLRCLSISNDNNKMLSGCVGSNVYYWDLEKKKVLHRIKHNRSQDNINTVNALGFKQNSSEFLVGTRDSIIQIYDVRDTNKPTFKFYSHLKKLNSACFSDNQYNILTSGRDSSLRLWDIRYIPSFSETEVKGYVQEYTQHRCEGYNIPALFMNNEESIITGSEDNRIIIYKTSNGEIETQYFVNNQIVHIVQPRSATSKFEFAYSCTQDSDIYFCGPSLNSEQIRKEKENQKKRQAKSKKGDKNVNEFQQLMQDHGDFILSIFHKNNFTYSQPLSWANVLTMALRDEENQQQSLQIIKKIMKTLIKNQMCFDEEDKEESDSSLNEESKDNGEVYKNQNHFYHMADDVFECSDLENQNNNFYKSCEICMKNHQKLKQIKQQFKQILQLPSNDYLINMYISNS